MVEGDLPIDLFLHSCGHETHDGHLLANRFQKQHHQVGVSLGKTFQILCSFLEVIIIHHLKHMQMCSNNILSPSCQYRALYIIT